MGRDPRICPITRPWLRGSPVPREPRSHRSPSGIWAAKRNPALASSLPRPFPSQALSPVQASGQMQPRQLQGRDRAGVLGSGRIWGIRATGFGLARGWKEVMGRENTALRCVKNTADGGEGAGVARGGMA